MTENRAISINRYMKRRGIREGGQNRQEEENEK